MHVHRVSRRQRILRQQRLLAEHVQESQHGERQHDHHGGRAVCSIVLRVDLLLQCVQFGNHFEILRPAGRALHANKPR